MENLVLVPKEELAQLIDEAIRNCLQDFLPTQAEVPTIVDAEQLLTKKQAAKLLGVSPSTIDNHARAGRLPRRYIGKSVRFSREEVLQLAKEKTSRKTGESMLNGKKRKE